MDKYDTLVLAGGGIHGFSIMGGVQYLMDNGLITDVKNYIGTSVGSVICYLLAIGYTPTEIMVFMHINNVLEKMPYIDIHGVANGKGVLSFSPLSDALDKATLQKIGKYLTLEKLRDLFGKTLICTTYNASKCKMEYLSPDTHPDLPCITALRMSANIPFVFDRFKYSENFYLDGGLLDNFAILEGQKIGKKVLGINLKIPVEEDNPSSGTISYILKIMRLQSSELQKEKMKNVDPEKCDVVEIENNSGINFIDFSITSRARLELFSEGYSQVKTIFSKPYPFKRKVKKE